MKSIQAKEKWGNNFTFVFVLLVWIPEYKFFYKETIIFSEPQCS